MKRIENIKNTLRYLKSYNQRKRKPLEKLNFEVHVVDHCNLNCKGCDNFSCLAEESYADLEIFRRDLTRIKDLFGNRVSSVCLIGGEPFLNPEIYKFCDIARNIFTDEELYIITNGTLLNKLNEITYESLRINRVTVKITRYPISFDYDTAMANLISKGIKTEFFAGDIELKELYCRPVDIEGRQNPKQSFNYCERGNQCISLREGKLYTCTFLPNVVFFNKYFKTNIVISDRDYVDIYGDMKADEILEFLSKAVPACRYCDNFHIKRGIPWGTTRKDISEWVNNE